MLDDIPSESDEMEMIAVVIKTRQGEVQTDL